LISLAPWMIPKLRIKNKAIPPENKVFKNTDVKVNNNENRIVY